jgi:hypothetical protein
LVQPIPHSFGVSEKSIKLDPDMEPALAGLRAARQALK